MRLNRLRAEEPEKESPSGDKAAPAAGDLRVPRTWNPPGSTGKSKSLSTQPRLVRRFASVFCGSGSLAAACARVGIPSDGWDLKDGAQADFSIQQVVRNFEALLRKHYYDVVSFEMPCFYGRS